MATSQQSALEENSTTIQLSVVVPVYNQSKNVTDSIARIRTILDSTLSNYEIVVVNDGSLDDTLQVLQNLEKNDPRLHVISYHPNMGKGHAVKTGIVASHGEIVMFTDGDLDISPNAIKDYFKELQDCDLVIASKMHPFSRIDAPLSRKFLSKAFNLLVRIVTGIRFKDTQSGLKAGNGSVLRTIFKVMLVKRYAFDVELLTIAKELGLNIKEMPIEITLDRHFKVKEILKMLIDVLAIAYRYRISHWYQKQLTSLPGVHSS